MPDRQKIPIMTLSSASPRSIDWAIDIYTFLFGSRSTYSTCFSSSEIYAVILLNMSTDELAGENGSIFDNSEV